jgi:hypothetical protein
VLCCQLISLKETLLLISDDNKKEQICLNESLLIAILIFWCIFQIILIVGCCYAIRRYKKYLELAEDKRVLHRVNQRMEFDRRVHWADQNSQLCVQN